MVIDSVLENILFGGILAIIILFLFLKDLKPTAVVACSIPISIVFAIVLMYFSGVTLNIISLSGLALGVGMLVDNSIVVIENIFRLRNEGVSIKKAAVDGAKEVTGAIIASTLTTVSVFLPIVFTQGITRQLFVDMALTIGYSLLASLIVAITFVPMMSSLVLKRTKSKENKLLSRIQELYGKLLEKALRYKAAVLAAVVALLVISALGAVRMGTAFMPQMDSTQISITMQMPEGSALDDTVEMSERVIDEISTIEDVDCVGAMLSTSLMGTGSSEDEVSMYVLLKEDKKNTNQEIARMIEDKTENLDCKLSVSTSSMDMSSLGGSGVSVSIQGKELETLQTAAKEVAKIVSQVEGTKDVSDGMEETTPELHISVNKEKAMAHGLTVAGVYQEISSRLKDASASTTLSTEDKDYSVYVKTETNEELTKKDIENLTIPVTKQDGTEEEVRIADIAEISDRESLNSINRENQVRYISVSASIEDGYNVGLVSNDIERALKDYTPPAGCTIAMEGESETINEALYELLKMLLLALVFMYLIMVAQFQSLLSPFIIMFTVPLAFTGGLFALVFTRLELSVIAAIGFVTVSYTHLTVRQWGNRPWDSGSAAGWLWFHSM